MFTVKVQMVGEMLQHVYRETEKKLDFTRYKYSSDGVSEHMVEMRQNRQKQKKQ
jgi:hypothetical protein